MQRIFAPVSAVFQFVCWYKRLNKANSYYELSDQKRPSHGQLCIWWKWYNRLWSVTLFQRVFDHSMDGQEIGERLLTQKQGLQRVAKYALDFCTLVTESGWSDPDLRAVYLPGLNELLSKGVGLLWLICHSWCAHKFLYQTGQPNERDVSQGQSKNLPLNTTPSLSTKGTKLTPSDHALNSAKSMDFSNSRIRYKERERHRKLGLSFCCGDSQHRVFQCADLASRAKTLMPEGPLTNASFPVSLTQLFAMPPISMEVQIFYMEITLLLIYLK